MHIIELPVIETAELCPTGKDLGMLMSSVCIVLLYLQEEGEWGWVLGGGGFEMRQLTLGKGPVRMGIRNHVRKAAIPSKGFSHLNNPLYL
jgi:hypothetical protein